MFTTTPAACSPWGQAAGYDDIVEILEHAEKADEPVFFHVSTNSV
jgi:hypothetical protein